MLGIVPIYFRALFFTNFLWLCVMVSTAEYQTRCKSRNSSAEHDLKQITFLWNALLSAMEINIQMGLIYIQ